MSVSNSLAAVAVVVGTVFVVGCSQMGQSTSPTAPSSALTVPTSQAGATSPSLVLPAAAPKQVPFKGTLQGDDVDTGFTATTVTVATSGTGNGTHLGQFSFTQIVTVTFATGIDTGSAHFIAANGDSIDTTIAGSGHPTAPNEFSITDVHTITGGTGRFAEAQGSFTVERVASGVTFLTSGSFDGTITSPGAAR